MASLKQSIKSEGENLLDAYEWFNDSDVMQTFVDTTKAAAEQDFSDTEEILIMGIGSGTALLEAQIDKQLNEVGFTPTTIATDALTYPSDQAKENLDKFFLLENKTMWVKGEQNAGEIDLGIIDSDEDRVISNSVDMVVARSVTHYEDTLKDEIRVLEQVKRILKPTGKFITQAPTPALPEERELFVKIHKVLPKLMNVQTKDETNKMLTDVFGDVVESEWQTDKKLTIDSKDFRERYAPAEEEYDSEESLDQARNQFSQKVEEIRELVESVPKQKRPNIWVDSDTFGWSVPYTTFVCSQ